MTSDAARTKAAARGARPAELLRLGWRDGIFLVIACAGSVAAAHVMALPSAASEPLGFLVRLRSLDAADLVAASLPLVIGLAALAGPLLVRIRWQLGLGFLGLAWLGLVALGLAQERWFGQSVDVARAAAGLAMLYALCLVLKPRRSADAADGAERAAAAAAR